MKNYALLYDRTPIQLGRKIGEGGEGTIFEIPAKADCVAKIYSKQLDAKKIQKLLSMPSLATGSLRSITAWPLDLVIDAQNELCGFVMPKITARKDIHELYSPKSRAIAFPEVDFRFLVHVCGNIARAFNVIHQHGHVIGDINHGSVLVGPDGKVAIIDCDSFQVSSAKNEVFTCDVGMLLFTAPELQGQNLRGFRRTLNHDYFGLAILLFHLLCMGRHPFAGRYSGSGDMPIERAIAELRFAYGSNRQMFGMDRPPGTPPLDTLGSAVSGLFEIAFAKTGTTSGRPDAQKWVTALDDLKSRLRVCSAIGWHHYSNELKSCPWCVVESQTGGRLFGQRIISTAPTNVVDVSTLWNAITAIARLDGAPSLPSEQLWTPPSGMVVPNKSLTTFRKAIGSVLVAGGLLGCVAGGPVALLLVGIGLAIWPWVPAETRAAAQRAVTAAKSEYENLRRKWQREATNDRFNDKWRELETAKNELIDLPNERRRHVSKLEGEREIRQRYRYLDGFKITQAKIRNIGVSRTAMLASFGIETAADVNANAIMKITGFGKVFTSALIKWREGHERIFRFNPNEPIDPHEIAMMDQKLGQRQLALLTQLRQGPQVLDALRNEVLDGRKRLMPLLRRLWDEYKLAEAHNAAL